MDEATVKAWLGELTLEEKCRLVGGASAWRTHPIERLGIPELKVSDGPNGVRGEFQGDRRTPAVVIPVGIAQGASWDAGLTEELGDLLGREARRRTAHVVLAPAVNLHRTPVGGRTFEYLSEDPELTAALAAGIVRGIQAHDVGVTVKHFVVNDSEIERMTVDVDVQERVIRELYLRPFEVCVRDAGAWGVMSAYNKVYGEHCAGNRWLLTEVLREEWGFDGFVVSDWFGAHDTVPSARAGLSLEMPGPARVYGEHLLAEVRSGAVSEEEVSGLVRDLLVLMMRTKADERSADGAETTAEVPEEIALCRRAAVAGTVMVRNESSTLPLTPGAISSLAVVGPNAAQTRIMGGGSSSLRSMRHGSILEVLRQRVADVRYEKGCSIDRHAPIPEPDQLWGPDGHPGLELAYYDNSSATGEPVRTGRIDSTHIALFGSLPDGLELDDFAVVARGFYRPRRSGRHQVGAIVNGRPRLTFGPQVVISGTERLERSPEMDGNSSVEQTAWLDLEAGQDVPVEIVWPRRRPFGSVRVGVREPDDGTMIERAAAAAAGADAAVVVVGTNEDWESEGHDRTSIALPGDQDDLVRAVAAANPRTVVVVNAGAPVAMPWAQEVPAILIPFFGGMEMSEAVVDVLLGEADPGGRLPTSFPHRLDDLPAWRFYRPQEGVQTYGEDFDIGYRGHDRSGVAPLFPFGHGLSYGEAEWGAPQASTQALAAGGSVTVTLPVSAPGDRAATVVVQGYVAPLDPPVTREIKTLRAWAKATVEPGTEHVFSLTFGPEAFRRWDPSSRGWVVDPGSYELWLGASSTDIRYRLPVEISP